MKEKITIVCIALSCITLTSRGQVRAMQTHTAQYSALNATPKQTSANKMSNTVSYGTVLPSAISAISLSPCANGNCQGISIRYEVPGFVVIDRFLLGANVHNKIAALMDDQQIWQNMSSSQVSDQTRQQMLNLYQGQIDQLQGISDALETNCAPVDFKGYSTHINADVRYNDPVSGTFQLTHADGSGNVDLTQLFNGVPYSILEGNPVRGTLLIYRK